MNTFEFKTRITSQDNGMSKLTITVKHDWDLRRTTSWKFTKGIYIIDTPELRAYLKSSDFKEFMSDLSDKYKGMEYKNMCELLEREKGNDTQKINEKLDKYLWTANSKSVSEHTDDFHFKITKRKCISEGSGVYGGYWHIQGRIYNKDYSEWRYFSYIENFSPDNALDLVIHDEMSDEEANAVYEKFNNSESYRKKVYHEYIDFLSEGMYCLIKNYNDTEEFYNQCNATIDDYNNRHSRWCA